MDETLVSDWRYYKLKGFKKPEDYFYDHLMMVYEIAKWFAIKNINFWSDMFFRLYSPTNYYYDYNSIIDQDWSIKFPRCDPRILGLYTIIMMWYQKWKKNILSLNRKMFNGFGTWVWTRFTYDKSQQTAAKLEMSSLYRTRVKDIIFTQWKDVVQYVDFDTVLLVFLKWQSCGVPRYTKWRLWVFTKRILRGCVNKK